MKNYLTSDTHFGHYNIIKYCNRPFKSVEEMNEKLIHNWNEIVKPEDLVHFLGDFCFRNSPGGNQGEPFKYEYYASKLNGNITFYLGNHDSNSALKTKLISGVVRFANQNFWLIHNPAYANPDYEINIVGHVHDAFRIKQIEIKGKKTIVYNVSTDVHNFKPITFDKVITDISKWRKNGCKDT